MRSANLTQVSAHIMAVWYTKFKFLPMGLSIIGAHFTNFMSKTLREIPKYQPYLFPIMDDLILFTPTEELHLEALQAVLQLFAKHGLKISPEKCSFAQQSFVYMGYNITFDDKNNPIITIEKGKCDAINNLPPPTSIRNLKGFVGMVLYLSQFLSKLQEVLKPLYELTTKKHKNKKFIWLPEHQSIFDHIKMLIQQAPVLYPPRKHGHFILYVDTSKKATGSSLFQIQDNEERLIAYHSKTLPDSAQRYSASELELTGMAITIKAFHSMLSENEFSIYTDHSALVAILQAKTCPATLRIQKLIERLSDYAFTINYMKGKDMFICDYLSRNPDPKDLPGTEIKQVCFHDISQKQAQNTLETITKEEQPPQATQKRDIFAWILGPWVYSTWALFPGAKGHLFA